MKLQGILMKHAIILSVILLFFVFDNNAQKITSINPLKEKSGEVEWVESVYNSLSLEQKIGQLFMPCCSAGKFLDNADDVRALIKEFHIGGIIFMAGDPMHQVTLTNEFQKLSSIPLLIATDAENSVAMRFKSLPSLPQQLMLGAIIDNTLVYDYGKIVGRQCARLGINVNFAPVADVNNNPFNPVIGNRSFGERVDNVAKKTIAFLNGLHESGVLACFKHFPGHGDTLNDSHEALPVITHSREHLDTIELKPFKVGIEAGVGAIMTAHLNVPVLDNCPHIPTSLSSQVVTDLLQNELCFDGLIFTDGLKMKGVRSFVEDDGSTELEAFKAGNHILLGTPFVKDGFYKIKYAVEQDISLQKLLEVTVKKILSLKYRLGLSSFNAISLANVHHDLIDQEFWDIKTKCIENAATFVGTNSDFLTDFALSVDKQLKIEHSLNKVAVVSFNSAEFPSFQNFFIGLDAACLSIDGEITPVILNSLLDTLQNYKHVILSIHGMNRFGNKRFGILESVEHAIKKIVQEKDALVVIFGTPYAVSFFKECPQVVVAYNDDFMTQEIIAQKLLGGNAFIGVLPISL